MSNDLFFDDDLEPREYTKEEVREAFLEQARTYVNYWSKQDIDNRKDLLEGFMHSILSVIDGVSAGLPAFDLVVRPHPDDKEYSKSVGDDWYPDGVVINDDIYLHEMWYKK